ncbi:MAG: hypothetical protein RQ741_09015, partial [Wenzhouxiangellaceae bacterium]|nr:hypothetical protein [Wenzhouxiangellaceae bacterium]
MLNPSAAARAQGILWTRPYLESLCEVIRKALEAWAGQPDAAAPSLDDARAAASQLEATLATLDIAGALGLAEALREALESVDQPDPETATVMLETVAVLPDYLERMETGAPDLPAVLSERVDRLRVVARLEPLPADRFAADLSGLDDYG